METTGSPRFLGDPLCHHAPLSDPGGPSAADRACRFGAAFRSIQGVGIHKSVSITLGMREVADSQLRASSPSMAGTASKPSSHRASTKVCRRASSSSTTRIIVAPLVMFEPHASGASLPPYETTKHECEFLNQAVAGNVQTFCVTTPARQ